MSYVNNLIEQKFQLCLIYFQQHKYKFLNLHYKHVKYQAKQIQNHKMF